MRELKLHQNKFTAIDALSDLRALEKLSLSEPNVTDVSTISGLTNLENLSVLNMKITEPEFLNNLENSALSTSAETRSKILLQLPIYKAFRLYSSTTIIFQI